MNQITLQAHAKINLSLDVTGKLENGYHTVKMVMQSLELHDDVTITRGTVNGIQMKSNLRFLPTDDSNLAVRAAMLLVKETGIKNDGIHIQLFKRIPVAAGLAGGSTNAAAVLRALNKLYDIGLSMDDLCEIGLKIGADVPYCLRGGSMLAEGIGEVLSPHVVVCKPPFSVVTANIYARMNGGKLPLRPDTAGIIQALEKSDYAGICHRLFNVMEAVTSADHTEIKDIEDTLLEFGADGTVMSGSGPTVFGLFSNNNKAQLAMQELKPHYHETYLTKILQEPNKIL